MPRRTVPWWIYPCAASFLAYFGLLVFCDVVRPLPEGLQVLHAPGVPGLAVKSVKEQSAGWQAGIRAGDAIVRADGHRLASRMDWEGIQVTLRLDRSLFLDTVRDGVPRRVEWKMARAGVSYFTRREGAELLLTRLVQFVSLLVGLLVVFRRPFDLGARLGGWMLATMGVLCISFPYRLATVWGSLPRLAGLPLWVPFCSSFALPALLLSFFLVFPRPLLRSRLAWAAIWLPAVLVVSSHVAYFGSTIYVPDAERHVVSWFDGRWPVWIAYLIAAAAAAIAAYRRADATERRRLGVMLLGGSAGAAAGGPIALAYWRGAETGLFESPGVAIATLLLLAVPLAFAYAILRHRLFDVRFIVRQGVRYALARRLLISIVPLTLLSLAVDIYLNRDRAVAELFVVRAPAYLAVAVAALLAQSQRQKWLDALDRRFFRDRYDAQRLLRGVLEGLHRAANLGEAAAPLVAQVEKALHPTFVALLTREPGRDAYVRLAEAPAGSGPMELPGGSRMLAIARALEKPLDLSAAGSAWLAEQLPPGEADTVAALGLELVVPVQSGDQWADAVLVLGGRRSGEPYALEDQELLWTIGRSLAVVGRRDRSVVGGMAFRECPQCGTCYDSGTPACVADTTPLAHVSLPRTLSGRYRLEQRLGRGGMGVVYSATDLSLGRGVAVKVLREELVGNAESAERFEDEARISARFTHPHVVTIHDFGVIQGARAFLVMERLEGTTLRDELASRGRFEPPRALAVMRGVCSAVESAHRRNLVHRDLKPENVFLARNDGVETPKILDFGIAKVLSESGGAGELRETGVGVMLGTPQYMAPEQLRGEAPAPSWDVWALAVITCEMLTGRHPFASLAFGLSSSGAPTAVAAVARDSESDPAWQPYLTRWLSVEPAGRPATAAAFFAELEQMLR